MTTVAAVLPYGLGITRRALYGNCWDDASDKSDVGYEQRAASGHVEAFV